MKRREDFLLLPFMRNSYRICAIRWNKPPETRVDQGLANGAKRRRERQHRNFIWSTAYHDHETTYDLQPVVFLPFHIQLVFVVGDSR